MNRIYEELFIVKPDAAEEEVDQYVEQLRTQLTAAGATVVVDADMTASFFRGDVSGWAINLFPPWEIDRWGASPLGHSLPFT